MIVNRYPTSQPFEETELIKTTRTTGHTAGGEVAAGLSPTVKLSAAATRTFGVDKTTSEWNVIPDIVDEVAEAVSGVSAIWKYAHNDVISNPVKKCTFNHKFHPRATFGFLTSKTQVEVELTVFWSSNRNSPETPNKLRDFFPVWFRTKKSNPIFFNFLHQIAVVVDLEKIPAGDAWAIPEMKTDNIKMEDLNPSKTPVPLERTTEIAQQYSKSGRIYDIVTTDCEVIIKAAVEGRVELTPEERTGVNIRCVVACRKTNIIFHMIGRQSVLLQIPQAAQSPDASPLSSAGHSAFLTPSPSPEPRPSAQHEDDRSSDITAVGTN